MPNLFLPHKTFAEKFAIEYEKLPPVTLTDQQLQNIASHLDVSGKVDKVTGKSLVYDTEIIKIHSPGSDNQDLSNLVVKESGKQLSTNDYTDAEETKLAGIETGANNYIHPANHSPSIITQDLGNRFVTDTEKSTWNGKSDLTLIQVKADTDVASAISLKHNNTLDHTAGTDQGLDTGGSNAVTAAQTKTAYTHSQSTHAPSNAQKNSDITDAEIQAKIIYPAFNSGYRNLINSTGSHIAGKVAGTYGMAQGNPLAVTGAGTLYSLNVIYIDSADYPTIAGKTPKLRIRCVIECNDVAPFTGTFVVGLHPVTRPATSGGAGLCIYTIGTAVAGSTVTGTNLAADSQNNLVGADFSIPANGFYVIAVVTSATMATSSHCHLSACLQIQYS